MTPQKSFHTSTIIEAKQQAGEICIRLFHDAITHANPELTVKNALAVQDNGLVKLRGSDGKFYGQAWSRIDVLAFGKAALQMADAALKVIPKTYIHQPALVVTTAENVAKTATTNAISETLTPHSGASKTRASKNSIRLMVAGHPIPNQHSVKAAEAFLARLNQATAGTLVLVLISGGGSALLAAPAPPLCLADKIAVTDKLLAAGVPITALNTIRKHLSRLKGGRMAEAAFPAHIHSLILSDVIGDDVSTIASGPTVPDPSSFADCVEILKQNSLFATMPKAVQTYLKAGIAGEIADTPKENHPSFAKSATTIIGSNSRMINALKHSAQHLNMPVTTLNFPLVGEARLAAQTLANWAKAWFASATTGQRILLICGGETTVTIQGTGKGGRNQELALAFAIIAEKEDLPPTWLLLAAGTDGRDGPTDAAGGIVTSDTLGRIRQHNLDPQTLLDDNDSYHALKASDALLITGATGTNVADLTLLCLWKKP